MKKNISILIDLLLKSKKISNLFYVFMIGMLSYSLYGTVDESLVHTTVDDKNEAQVLGVEESTVIKDGEEPYFIRMSKIQNGINITMNSGSNHEENIVMMNTRKADCLRISFRNSPYHIVSCTIRPDGVELLNVVEELIVAPENNDVAPHFSQLTYKSQTKQYAFDKKLVPGECSFKSVKVDDKCKVQVFVPFVSELPVIK